MTQSSALDYYERITCSSQWMEFNRALALELTAGLPPEENRQLFARIGERVAQRMPVARCNTLAELETAFNARWESIEWGFVRLQEDADALTITHACSPLAVAFGAEASNWTLGFLEGAYQAWFGAQGIPPGLHVRALSEPATLGASQVQLALGRLPA